MRVEGWEETSESCEGRGMGGDTSKSCEGMGWMEERIEGMGGGDGQCSLHTLMRWLSRNTHRHTHAQTHTCTHTLIVIFFYNLKTLLDTTFAEHI